MGRDAAGGLSSSAALTTCAVLILQEIMSLSLTPGQVSCTDYAEHFLGRLMGASDKMAQVSCQPGKVCISCRHLVPLNLVGNEATPSEVEMQYFCFFNWDVVFSSFTHLC